MKRFFNLSVSKERYTEKNNIRWATVRYQQRELSVDDFCELIKQGYCFCHCFSSTGSEISQSEKRDSKFESAQMVFIDIDNSEIPMSDFVGRLNQKPSVAYTTPNNHTENSNWLYRFRLCYFLNELITSVSEYAHIYDGIIQSICTDIPDFRITDNCGRKASQQFSGNGKDNVELYQSDIVYSHSDFPFENNNASFSSFYKSETEKPIRKSKEIEIADEKFISDVKNLKSTDLIEKYRTHYPYFNRTELKFEDGYAIIPDDYQEIYRSWYRDTFEKTNGINLTVIKKHRDGEGRRKKLFIAGLIMKKIKPNITYEHLLYNLICERTWHHDNSDGVISNNVLSEIAKNVINTPVEEIHLQSRHKKKFEIDKAYCAEHGISPNTMKNIVRKKLKDEEIGNLYDVSKSVSENLVMLREMGLKIGKTKLYEWCQENGISTKGDKKNIATPIDLLSSFSKEDLRIIIEEQESVCRYFIADDAHKEEIPESQYYELLQIITLVA